MKNILCITICCILGFSNVVYAFPLQKILPSNEKTYKINNDFSFESKEIKYQNDSIDIDINIPIVKGIKNKEAEQKINKLFEKDIMEFNKQLEQAANENLEYSQKVGIKVKPYKGNVKYKVHSNQSGLLSVSIIYYSYAGGNHGNTTKQTLNIDPNTGNEARLKDLFYKDEKYKKIISSEVKKQIRQRTKLNKASYFEEELYKVDSISDDENFYIDDKNLVIYYGEYELSPYSSGIQEFKIPFSMFKKGLKRDIAICESPVKVNCEKIVKKDKALLVDLKVPIIEGIKNKELQDKLNEEYRNDIDRLKAEGEKSAKEEQSMAKKEDREILQYDLRSDFQVNYNENDFLSISLMYYKCKGAEEGTYKKISRNINLSTGKEMLLRDMFKDKIDYKKIINNEIKMQIKKYTEKLKKEVKNEKIKHDNNYTPYKNFKGISDNQSFFIENGNIVIYFDVGEIGEKIDGEPKFRIPISKFKSSIKKEFLNI